MECRQAIIWVNIELLLFGPLWTDLSEVWITIFIHKNESQNVVC